MNRYSSRPIQRLTIEREAATNLNTAVKSGTLTKVQGNKLMVAAPQKLVKAAPSAKPPAVKAKVAQPKMEHGWKGVPNRAELEQKIKTENPKNIPPPTRAAAREAGSPVPGPGTSPAGAERGPAATPVRGGRAGRVAPGATQAPSLGESPLPGERGRGRPGARPRAGATAGPREGARRGVSPSPAEEGRPGGRARPGVTARPSGPREGVSPSPFERGRGRGPAGAREGVSPSQQERGKGRGQPGERSPRPGAAGEPRAAGRATQPPALEGAPPQQQEQRREPVRRPGEEANPARGGLEQTPQQQSPPPQQFGTAAPMGAREQGQPRGGAPSEARQQVAPPAGGAHTDEARAQRERMQQGGQAQPAQQSERQPQQHSSSNNNGVARLRQPITDRDTGSRKADIKDNQDQRRRRGSNNFSAITPAAPEHTPRSRFGCSGVCVKRREVRMWRLAQAPLQQRRRNEVCSGQRTLQPVHHGMRRSRTKLATAIRRSGRRSTRRL